MDEIDGALKLAGLLIGLPKAGARLLGPLARLSGYSLELDEGYERGAR